VNRVKLHFKSVADIVGTTEVSLITLTDEYEQRQITIVCDKMMARQLSVRASYTPLTRMLLPEVLLQFISIHTNLSFEVLINGITDGQYQAVLQDTAKLSSLPIRISDAVLLSIISNVPIYIDEALMHRQSVRYNEGDAGIAMPVNSLSISMLKEALDKAISSENYELASHLRDEIRRRQQSERLQ
jgi:Uncharacterized conserved protein